MSKRKLGHALKAIGGAAALVASLYGLVGFWQFLNPEIRRFDKDYVYFNEAQPVNDAFVEFLRKNDGRTVQINTQFDFSPAMPEHYVMLNECNKAYQLPNQSEEEFRRSGGSGELLDGKIYNVDIEIPHTYGWYEGESRTVRSGCNGLLQVHLASTKALAPVTSGGTGIVLVRARGVFDVHREKMGANERLVLTEVDRQ